MSSDRKQTIVVLDFGSQYTQLIARRVREQKVFATILPCTAPLERLREIAPIGIILSGGPASVYEPRAPRCAPEIFALGVPVLGICYGAQLMAQTLGGQVRPAESREFGHAALAVIGKSALFEGLPLDLDVWMSHGDQISRLPAGFCTIAKSATCPHAAIADEQRRLYGVQFHPEVVHTPRGREVLRNFLYGICGARGDWEMSAFIDETVQRVRAEVGDARVVLGLSGGVDSSVTAVLLHRALGEQLHCIFVDNGLLRKGECERVVEKYGRHFQLNLRAVRAGERFLAALAGVVDPEAKRKIIGRIFIEVFEEEARRIPGVRFLAQGTLYPDVIESTSAHGGPTAVIKSHHNVGGLPEKLGLTLIEPLRDLFKDEVRELGLELGMPENVIWRHPFPGPGLAVRIIGEVTAERVQVLQNADDIVLQEIHASGWYRKVWQ
ncbi:MAG: glutamine-hydrolyzing GMP synthase, partial [Planctomycetota bacterium]|nr:glutamine-hydrolyzing GMP synthase [Planctomycetota bacterium]